jgi:hypothetical protein
MPFRQRPSEERSYDQNSLPGSKEHQNLIFREKHLRRFLVVENTNWRTIRADNGGRGVEGGCDDSSRSKEHRKMISPKMHLKRFFEIENTNLRTIRGVLGGRGVGEVMTHRGQRNIEK